MAPDPLPGDEHVERWRAAVPGLGREVHGRPLVYMDYASTAQRPRPVLDAVERACVELNANVGRGFHRIAADASQAYADARERVAGFVSAPANELVFTGGATDGLNMAAAGISATWRRGDRILVSVLDHHANLIPWQLAAGRSGARVEPIALGPDHGIDLAAFERQLDAGRVRVVALPLVSNVLGTRPEVEAVAERAHRVGATVVLDAAQAVAHGPLDVAALGADVVAFSAHKLFGPLGIGALWARAELLASWSPWRGGGGIVREVRFDETTFRAPPARFEAGTPNVAGALGFAAALDWLEGIGWERIQARERALIELGGRILDEVPGLGRLSRAPSASIFAWSFAGVHPHDVGSILDLEGIAVRAGRHCADPLHEHLGLLGSTRASLSFLTTSAEVHALGQALERVREVFGG